MNEQQYYNKTKRNKERYKFYKSKAWSDCRKLVLTRDHYLCQSCLSKKKIVQADVVHHKKELKDYPELALDLNNLVSWCHSCHNAHHKRLDHKQNKANNKLNVIISNENKEEW